MKIEKLFKDWEAVEEVEAGGVIFSEREPAEFVYVVLSGEVELTLQGEPLGTEGPGGIIGEMAVVDAGTRSSTATARSAVRLARLEREDFHQLARKYPKFSIHAMTALANRLRAVDRFISTRLER